MRVDSTRDEYEESVGLFVPSVVLQTERKVNLIREQSYPFGLSDFSLCHFSRGVVMNLNNVLKNLEPEGVQLYPRNTNLFSVDPFVGSANTRWLPYCCPLWQESFNFFNAHAVNQRFEKMFPMACTLHQYCNHPSNHNETENSYLNCLGAIF